jgi:hypothetical protein
MPSYITECERLLLPLTCEYLHPTVQHSIPIQCHRPTWAALTQSTPYRQCPAARWSAGVVGNLFGWREPLLPCGVPEGAVRWVIKLALHVCLAVN